MLSQTGPGLKAEPRQGQWGPWTRLNQGSSDGAHSCGLMRHCREDYTGLGHGYTRGRGDRARLGGLRSGGDWQ